MCCFSRPIGSVSNTQIFCRQKTPDIQMLVYGMKISAHDDLAMILPIPVRSGSPENAVRFISLESYPNFFSDLDRGFPNPIMKGRSVVAPTASLAVVTVGSYEASFVPTIKDFERLDVRFRLPSGVWDHLPQYKHHGFAVFKLKAGAHRIHPMAFEFPTRLVGRLYFPTVHIHDGSVHPTAHFDHELYAQPGDGMPMAELVNWRESSGPANTFMNMGAAQGLVDGEKHCYFITMRGTHKNEDVLV